MSSSTTEPETSTSDRMSFWKRRSARRISPLSVSCPGDFGSEAASSVNESDRAIVSTTVFSNGLPTSFAYRNRIAITAVCAIAGLSGTLLSAPDVREGSSTDHLFDGFGWFLLGLAIVLRLWSSGHISGRKSRTLVTTGPYAICRNPQYIGTLAIAVSQALILKSYPFALACVLPILLYPLGVVPAEERVLHEKFGAVYGDYCRQVPRWSFCWSGLNFKWRTAENWTAFRHECVRCVWWLLLPLASEFICALREQIWLAN